MLPPSMPEPTGDNAGSLPTSLRLVPQPDRARDRAQDEHLADHDGSTLRAALCHDAVSVAAAFWSISLRMTPALRESSFINMAAARSALTIASRSAAASGSCRHRSGRRRPRPGPGKPRAASARFRIRPFSSVQCLHALVDAGLELFQFLGCKA